MSVNQLLEWSISIGESRGGKWDFDKNTWKSLPQPKPEEALS